MQAMVVQVAGVERRMFRVGVGIIEVASSSRSDRDRRLPMRCWGMVLMAAISISMEE